MRRSRVFLLAGLAVLLLGAGAVLIGGYGEREPAAGAPPTENVWPLNPVAKAPPRTPTEDDRLWAEWVKKKEDEARAAEAARRQAEEEARRELQEEARRLAAAEKAKAEEDARRRAEAERAKRQPPAPPDVPGSAPGGPSFSTGTVSVPTPPAPPPSAPAASPSSREPGQIAFDGGRGGGGGQAKKAPAPADDLPDFPWPPPRPSSREEIDRALIVPAGGGESTLRGVADRLEAALKRAQYEYSFYAVPGGGFALVARLERIGEDGAAIPGDRRFLPPDAKEPFDLGRYVSALFFAPAGYYRMIALVVTDQPIVADKKALDEKIAQQLPGAGATALPAPFAARPFGPDHRVYALIYEFRKQAEKGDAEALVPGRLPARTHLSRSGLEPALH